MKRRHAVFGAAAILGLSLAVPALGGPSNPIAEKALSLTKVNKKAKQALTAAKSAQGTANAAQTAANGAQGTANTALSTAQGNKVRWAFVKADGTVQAQSGGISVQVSATNNYYIDFGSSQLNHALIATPSWTTSADANTGIATALCGGTANPGGAICAPSGTNDVNHVYVLTQNPPGTDTANAFYIASIP